MAPRLVAAVVGAVHPSYRLPASFAHLVRVAMVLRADADAERRNSGLSGLPAPCCQHEKAPSSSTLLSTEGGRLMIGLFPYLAAGLLLLALFVHLVLRRGTEDHDFDVSSEVEGQETRLESRGILPQLTARLFRSEDWEFVTKQGSARLERLFLQQRTAHALAWVRRVRAYVEELMRTHR